MEINASVAFFFGALSFFSPCVLPLVPGYFAIFSLNKNSKISKVSGAFQFVSGFSRFDCCDLDSKFKVFSGL